MSKSPFAPETFKHKKHRFFKVIVTNIFAEEKIVTDNFSFVPFDRFFLSPPYIGDLDKTTFGDTAGDSKILHCYIE